MVMRMWAGVAGEGGMTTGGGHSGEWRPEGDGALKRMWAGVAGAGGSDEEDVEERVVARCAQPWLLQGHKAALSLLQKETTQVS